MAPTLTEADPLAVLEREPVPLRVADSGGECDRVADCVATAVAAGELDALPVWEPDGVCDELRLRLGVRDELKLRLPDVEAVTVGALLWDVLTVAVDVMLLELLRRAVIELVDV